MCWLANAAYRMMLSVKQQDTLCAQVTDLTSFCRRRRLLLLCRYARSIVSCVNNARKLQHSLVPAERELWRCVWEEEEGGNNWSTYTATALTGQQRAAAQTEHPLQRST